MVASDNGTAEVGVRASVTGGVDDGSYLKWNHIWEILGVERVIGFVVP